MIMRLKETVFKIEYINYVAILGTTTSIFNNLQLVTSTNLL